MGSQPSLLEFPRMHVTNQYLCSHPRSWLGLANSASSLFLFGTHLDYLSQAFASDSFLLMEMWVEVARWPLGCSKCVFAKFSLYSLIWGMNTEDPVKDCGVIGNHKTTRWGPGMTEWNRCLHPHWSVLDCGRKSNPLSCSVTVGWFGALCHPWGRPGPNRSWLRSPEISIFRKPLVNSEVSWKGSGLSTGMDVHLCGPVTWKP